MDFRSPKDVRDPATRVEEGSRKGQGRVKEGEIHIPRFGDPLGEHLIKKNTYNKRSGEDLSRQRPKAWRIMRTCHRKMESAAKTRSDTSKYHKKRGRMHQNIIEIVPDA